MEQVMIWCAARLEATYYNARALTLEQDTKTAQRDLLLSGHHQRKICYNMDPAPEYHVGLMELWTQPSWISGRSKAPPCSENPPQTDSALPSSWSPSVQAAPGTLTAAQLFPTQPLGRTHTKTIPTLPSKRPAWSTRKWLKEELRAFSWRAAVSWLHQGPQNLLEWRT